MELSNNQLQALKQAGFSQSEIEQYAPQLGYQAPKSWTGFGRNIVKSTGNLIGNTVSGVVNIANPNLDQNTVFQIFKLANGLIDSLIPGEQGSEKYAQGLADYFINRYGSLDNIANTFYNDPAGLVDDAAMFLTSGGTAVSKLGKIGKMGEVAQIGADIAKWGNKIDPILGATRGITGAIEGTSDLVNPLKKSVGNQLTGLSDELSMRSLRPSPSQQKKFTKLTGKTIPEYRRGINQFGGAEDTIAQQSERINAGAKKYNALTRTGEIVDPTPYIDQLRQRAREIVQTDFSEEAQKVANDLMKRADNLETKALQYMQVNNTNGIPIDIITETKSSAYSKVPQGAMMNQSVLLGNKEAGRIGRNVLEKMAPGSSAAGKQLQADILLKDIAEQQSGLGKGTQIINAFKPAGYGSGLGGILGGVQGAIIGGITASTVNNPKVLGQISKGAYTLGNKLQNAKKISLKIPSSVNTTAQTLRPVRLFERIKTENNKSQAKQLLKSGKNKQSLSKSNTITAEIEKSKKKNPFTRL